MNSQQIQICLAGWIFLFCMIIPLFLSFADANNQGLVWGVEEGTQLDYRLTLTETNESLTITVLD